MLDVRKGKVNSLAMEEKDMQMAYDENQIQVLEGLGGCPQTSRYVYRDNKF